MQEDSFNINNVAIRLPIDQQGLSLLRHDYSVEYRRGEVDPAYYLSDHPAKHGAETSQLQKLLRSTSVTCSTGRSLQRLQMVLALNVLK